MPGALFVTFANCFAEKRDGTGQFIFKDMLSENAERETGKDKEYLKNMRDSSIILLTGDEWRYKYSASVYILKRLSFPWSFVGQFLSLIPHQIGDILYDFVSKNRDLFIKVVRYLCEK